jgi:hypothetical protein
MSDFVAAASFMQDAVATYTNRNRLYAGVVSAGRLGKADEQNKE